jgi:hypothetical protein
VLHGYLKVEMLDVEELMHETHEQDETDRLDGYLQALTNVYTMTYNLSIDRKLIEERANA